MDSRPQTPLAVLGRYQLWEKLAQGGMAELFLATLTGPGGFEKTAVVKRMLPELAADPSYREMFEQEARVMASLSHSHVLSVLDFGEAQGTYYLALEYVDGLDLARVMKSGVAVTAPVAVSITLAVLRGLDHVHRQRDAKGEPLHIVHRDISPQNVLLGRNGDVKIGDFGIAKTLRAPARTAPGSTRGKLGYMSPEQAQGKPLDGRADLFSVAVVLYELLMGKSPFAATSDGELLPAVQAGRMVSLDPLALAVGAPFAGAMRMALAADREQRFSTGEAMARALETAHPELASAAEVGALVQRALLLGAPEGETAERTPHEVRSPFSAVLLDVDLKGT